MAEEIIKARVWTKVDTLENWNNNPLLLGPGEMALVTTPSGIPLNMKWGDKTERKRFSDLPFAISYDQGQFVAIDGPGELPTPVSEVGYSLVGPGTYTYPGQADIVIESDEMGILVWGNSEWILSSVIDIPNNSSNAPDWESKEYSKGDLVINNGVLWVSLTTGNLEEPIQDSENWKRISTYDLVDYFLGGEDKAASARDVKELNERIEFYDRPDLMYKYFIADKENNVVDRLLSENHDSYRFLPEGLSFYTIDRPDLGAIILVDKDGLFLSDTSTGDSGGGASSNDSFSLPLWNPPEQGAFSVGESGSNSIVGNYDSLIAAYDDLMANENTNDFIDPYVTRDIIGYSGVDDIPIYKYAINNPNAKSKVLLIGGTHANEKLYIWTLYYFMKHVLEDWQTNPLLEYFRWNVQLEVLPCRSPYTIANSVRARGFRVVPETTPIPFSWTKSGGTVTLTFDTGDFPDDGFLSGANYFTAVPAADLEGKTSFGVITSSDEVSIPLNAYKIGQVIAGNSISFTVPSGGASSGTGTFQVWVDPNRNAHVPGTTVWSDFVGGTGVQQDDAGNTVGFADNKGTRPSSLVENRALFALANQERYDYAVDAHSNASYNYISYDRSTGFIPDIDKILAESGYYENRPNQVNDSINSINPLVIRALTVGYNTPAHTIEWGGGTLYSATGDMVRGGMRWLSIVLKDSIAKVVNK